MAAYLPYADVRIVRSDNDADTTMSTKGAATDRPLRPSAGVHHTTEMQQGEGVRDVTVGTGHGEPDPRPTRTRSPAALRRSSGLLADAAQLGRHSDVTWLDPRQEVGPPSSRFGSVCTTAFAASAARAGMRDRGVERRHSGHSWHVGSNWSAMSDET